MQLYTITGRNDGFGAQYHAIMSGIAICKYKNYTYAHSPFKHIGLTSNVQELNDFIGIPEYNLDKNEPIVKEIYSNVVHSGISPSLYYTNTVIKQIRDFYYSTTKPKIPDIDIAIHIRRGDVNSTKNAIRFTSNAIYIKIIDALKLKYPQYKITIFSEGNVKDFAELKLDDIQFRLNEDILQTFHSLVCAKVLIMSKSSFSYSAAILNANIVYYTHFWHMPLNTWLNVDTLCNIQMHTPINTVNKKMKMVF